MACNCGKRKRPPAKGPEKTEEKKEKYTLRLRDGRKVTFGSKLEWDAAKVRHRL